MKTASADSRKARLTPEGEAHWLRLKQHLEWSETFSLGFIFSSHPEVVEIFKERLAAIYRARVTKLNTSLPSLPEELTTTLLPLLLNPSENKVQLKQPFWLDLSTESGTDWQRARVSFLIRLNEQRESLRRTLHSPVILILPQKERYDIKTLVPDLWAIRDFSMETGQWVKESPLQLPSDHQAPSRILSQTPQDKSMIKEWERLMKRERKDQGFLFAAQRAFKAAMKTGQYELAASIAKSQYDFCIPKKETPEALRDLSVSLNNVGEIEQTLKKYHKAKKNFREGLNIARKLSKEFSELEAYRSLESHFRARLDDLEKDS